MKSINRHYKNKSEKVEFCPTCKSAFRLITNCPKCGIKCCSQCSIDRLCINCFVSDYIVNETIKYQIIDDNYRKKFKV